MNSSYNINTRQPDEIIWHMTLCSFADIIGEQIPQVFGVYVEPSFMGDGVGRYHGYCFG